MGGSAKVAQRIRPLKRFEEVRAATSMARAPENDSAITQKSVVIGRAFSMIFMYSSRLRIRLVGYVATTQVARLCAIFRKGWNKSPVPCMPGNRTNATGAAGAGFEYVIDVSGMSEIENKRPGACEKN